MSLLPDDFGSSQAPAVVVEHLTHRFPARRAAHKDEVVALADISVTVPSGEVFGLLGPNGAGKTTLLRILSTLLIPSEGGVRVLGYDPARQADALRRHIGVVLGGERSVYWRLTGRENLLYAAALHDLTPDVAAERAAALLQLVGLDERADDLVERYSSGMRQRLALARALVHDPPVLILDEPTAGLDPHAAQAVRALLVALHRDGSRTILLATHNLDEADRLCGTIAIIDHGRILACGAPVDLKTQNAGTSAEATLEEVFLELTGRTLAAADTTGL
ncbi:MAG TPA: ABC transporter ATP-binding protein [bacterium]|nr:ABC transporter ATP-binding protein [bacterium]